MLRFDDGNILWNDSLRVLIKYKDRSLYFHSSMRNQVTAAHFSFFHVKGIVSFRDTIMVHYWVCHYCRFHIIKINEHPHLYSLCGIDRFSVSVTRGALVCLTGN